MISHPQHFEISPYKKEKYKVELAQLAQIKATTGLRPPADEFDILESLIFSTMDEIGSPIGAADREQLASAIHAKSEIVTNDTPFTDVAEALEVVVHTAEKIVIEAHSQSIVTKEEVITARAIWEKNEEKAPSKEEKKILDGICSK